MIFRSATSSVVSVNGGPAAFSVPTPHTGHASRLGIGRRLVSAECVVRAPLGRRRSGLPTAVAERDDSLAAELELHERVRRSLEQLRSPWIATQLSDVVRIYGASLGNFALRHRFTRSALRLSRDQYVTPR